MTQQKMAMDVKAYLVEDYWDGVRSGWLRAGGRYYWFELSEGGAPAGDGAGATWEVFDLPRDVRLAHLLHARRFRCMVGRRWDVVVGRREPRPELFPKPGFRAFYDLPRPSPFDARRDGRRIGVTDLRRVTLD